MQTSLKSIRTFVATVRATSFTRAAAVLNVSQGAVSQQIARLEDYLGVQLFERTPAGLRLTVAGRRLFLAVGESIDRIEHAVTAARMTEQRQQLVLTSLNGFAAQWLIPRLTEFERRFPDIRLRLETGAVSWDLAAKSVDAGIRFGGGQWKGLTAELLFEEALVPVAAPAFAATLARGEGIRALVDASLVYDLDVPTQWAQWFAAAGIDGEPNLVHGYSDNLVMIAALACNPDRVALLDACTVDRELADGRLVQLFDAVSVTNGAYYLVYPADGAVSESLAAFRDWLFETVADYVPARTRAGR